MSVGAVNKQTGDRIPTAGMPAIDDALDLTSVNPVQNAIVAAALANKQDKTDNSLQTTDKTIVGAINEVKGDADSLKSGLTNVNAALDVPNGTGKNLIPLTIDNLKAGNTNGTWTGNVYVDSGLTFTVNTDSAVNVTDITVTGTNSGDSNYSFVLFTTSTANIRQLLNGKSLTLNGCPSGGGSETYSMFGYRITATGGSIRDSGSGVDFEGVNMSQSFNLVIAIGKDYAIASSLVFTPMIRLSAITDPTFAPYIPSVESRIEAVESATATTKIVLTNYLPDVNIDYYRCKQIGKFVSGVVKITTSAEIAAYNIIITGLPRGDVGAEVSPGAFFAGVASSKTALSGGICNIANSDYAGVGLTTALPAGTYALSFSYFTT